MSRARAADAGMRATRDKWVELLLPLVGEPPPGVNVPKPSPTWAIMLVVLGVALVVVGVIAAVTVAL